MTTTTLKSKKNKAKVESNKVRFSPSVNIVRDSKLELNYIPTPNSSQVFDQLANSYQSGIHSFSIVGAYGTGKSAFLWALEKTLVEHRLYFDHDQITNGEIKTFEFWHFVGEPISFMQVFADKLNINFHKDTRSSEILRKLDKHHSNFQKSSKGLAIIVDEFGKHLEYAAKNDPGRELYFIQQLAEYVNDPEKNILFITSLHQDFNGYARALTKSQQNEWDKVKGRLKEMTFNEPVEQLLLLASERIAQLGIGVRHKSFLNLFKAIDTAKVFPLRDLFNHSIAEKLLPFDILSASVLTLSLQKYGQNERSLFSFIESHDPLGIRDFNVKNAPHYNLSSVYDYLIHTYYSFLTTKHNPHYAQWAAIRTAIERAEGFFNREAADAVKLVKTIGLLNIFASAGARINPEFLRDYGSYALGITAPHEIVKKLEKSKIIRFVKHSNRYILFEGTDLDIELAIDEAGNLVERVTNVVNHLNKYFDFPYISAKSVYYETGTPRFFAFRISDKPEILHPEGEIDGFINLVFSNKVSENDIKKASQDCDNAILYGHYDNTNEIKELIFLIEKIKKVKENHPDDRVAIRELEKILQHQISLLNHYVIGNMYSANSPVTWYYQGKRQHIKNQKAFNQLLSQICSGIYPQTPNYRNEMINKSKLSPPIITARRSFVKALVDSWSEKEFGFDKAKFPPEKTIYLSLLRETGIHHRTDDGFVVGKPTDPSFQPLWNACMDFMEQSRQGKRNLQELADILLSKPFKLKQGFIDFWLPVFLFCRRDDFALFYKGIYIPFLSQENLDLICKNPRDYEVKEFDIEGVKLNLFNRYRSLLSQSQQKKPTGRVFIDTIRPFLTFYKDLKDYSKKTTRLSKKALALRDAIVNSKDPEETFFVQFPKALGYSVAQLQKNRSQLGQYIDELQSSLREIRTSYDELVTRVERFLVDEFVGGKSQFPAYKTNFQKHFSKLKIHLLLPYQKVFYQRVMSELDDRKDWLNSITQACVGKSLEDISDNDEVVLYEKLRDIVHELDNLVELTKADVDEGKEEVFKLEITSFVAGLKKNLIRLPKNKNVEAIQQQAIIKSKLGTDRRVNISVLLKLLQEQLSNEK